MLIWASVLCSGSVCWKWTKVILRLGMSSLTWWFRLALQSGEDWKDYEPTAEENCHINNVHFVKVLPWRTPSMTATISLLSDFTSGMSYIETSGQGAQWLWANRRKACQNCPFLSPATSWLVCEIPKFGCELTVLTVCLNECLLKLWEVCIFSVSGWCRNLLHLRT